MSSITCDEADQLLAARALGDPAARADRALQAHRDNCPDCQESDVEHRQTATRLVAALEPAAPPPALRTRVMASLYQEVDEPARAHTWWAALWEHIPSGRGFSLAGVAASVAVAAIVVINVAGHRAAVLHAVAAGQPAQPQAQAQLSIDTSSHMATVDASLMPAPGKVYQLWLVRPDKSIVASSYVTLQPDGHFTAAMVMAADPPPGSHFWLTLEPHAGDSAPLGPEVINVEVPTG